MRSFKMLFALCCFGLSTAVVMADNTNPNTIHLSPSDDWFKVLNGSGLNPGDEVVLSAGTYSHSSRLSFRSFGTAENPIVVRAAEGAKVVITRPRDSQNVIDIEGAQYATFRGLDIVGGSAGIRIRRKSGRQPTSLTFEDMVIRNTASGGITANESGTTYDGLIFRRNEVRSIGGLAGFYLGCNNASGGVTDCVFKNGLVEGNYIHDLGSGVGDGIQIKDGSYNNIIRDNVILNTGGAGSVGILVYGTDGNARNIIEGNVIWNSGDNAIQAASEATIRNNIIFSSGAGFNGIASQVHQSAIPGNLTIVNNTVFSTDGDDALDINYGGPLSGPIIVANNALYATQGGRAIRVPSSGDVTVVGNVGMGNDSPGSLSNNPSAWNPNGDFVADFDSFASMNAFPIAGSSLIGAGDAIYQPEVDFNGVSRSGGNDVGAYVYDPNGNPGWQIGSAFKEFPRLLTGDYNGDGTVDAADYTVWRDSLNSTTELAADGNADGVVDADDYNLWKGNYGATSVSVSATVEAIGVPEPATLPTALLLCGLALGTLRRRRRSN